MGHTGHASRSGIALLVALLAVTWAPAPPRAAKQRIASSPRHHEVVLETDGKTFAVVSHRLGAGRPSAPSRNPDPGTGYTVEARDDRGRVAGVDEVGVPLIVHYDALVDQQISGGVAALIRARFVVQLPDSGDIEELRISGGGASAVVPLGEVREHETAAVPASTTIRRNGPIDERVDLVFLGDGYTAAELGRYRQDVERMTDSLFREPPFSEYALFFNVHRVDVVSRESGTDDPCAGTIVDTALDVGFDTAVEGCRALFTRRSDKVHAAAAGAPAADVIVVITNTERYGGAATFGGYAVVHRGPHSAELMAHELGHSLGWLADEYAGPAIESTNGPLDEIDPSAPHAANITTLGERSATRWRRWIAPETAVPTTTAAADEPGLYEGANLSASGVYRPTYDSKMRTLYQPFDRVNHALLVEQIFSYIPQDRSAPTGLVRLGTVVRSGRVAVDLHLVDPESYVHSYQLSNYPDFRDSAAQPASNAAAFDQVLAWKLLAGPGPKTVHMRATNGAGSTSSARLVVGDHLGARAVHDACPPLPSPRGVSTAPTWWSTLCRGLR